MPNTTLFVDLFGDSVTLAEPGGLTWLHALPHGKFNHPVYGVLEFTPERTDRFAKSVNEKYRGTEPDIDYGHKQFREDAAGWVKAADARDDGLWVGVEFTDAARTAIQEKRWRYFSSEITKKWTDEETGDEYEDVFLGGGLTNRPFMRRLQPYSLDDTVTEGEFFVEGEQPTDPRKVGEDLPEWLLTLLGLPKEATEEQLKEAVTAKLAELNRLSNPPAPPAPAPQPNPEPVRYDSPDQLATMLSEHPLFKQMQTDLDAAKQQLKQEQIRNEAAAKFAAVQARIKDLSEGEGYGLPIPARVILEQLMFKLSDEHQDELVKLFSEIKGTGLIKLGEYRGNGPGTGARQIDDDNPIEHFNALVAKAQEADPKLSYRDALGRVSTENPEAYRNYRNASFIEGEVKA